MDEMSAPAPLQGLRPLAWGLLLVVLDLRIEGVDLVPDPVGWIVALLAVARLASLHRGFAAAAVGCVVGLLVSLPDWVQPDLTWVGLLTAAAETVVVFGTCTALMVLVPARRKGVAAIRAWDLGLTVVGLVLAALAAGGGGVPGVLVLVLVVAAITVMVCFLVLLFRVSGDAREMGPNPRVTRDDNAR